eukprot:275242_1
MINAYEGSIRIKGVQHSMWDRMDNEVVQHLKVPGNLKVGIDQLQSLIAGTNNYLNEDTPVMSYKEAMNENTALERYDKLRINETDEMCVWWHEEQKKRQSVKINRS